uniref:RRM domain-containing protein n=1 Tax=Ciona savignyi TaxID=51511 RepID=H2YT83_CIOSA
MVWRWIQVSSPSKKQQTPGRVWQGEAFDTNRSINTPNISPTPCLKIRNMFERDNETGDNWHLAIQDSILEKCRGNNGILCIRVEKASTEGLVYMKCSTNQGAGQAFKSLHGSWFDGRLVTVKFISLNRFHSHYPDSVGLTSPLTPTSSTPVSTFLPPSPGFTTSTPLHPH